MNKKKSDKSNLETKRVLYFEMGMVITLAAILVAFEWGTTEITISELTGLSGYDNEVWEMPATKRELPKIKPPIVPEEIILIANSEPEIEDIEIDWGTEIDVNGDIQIYTFKDEKEVKDDIPFISVQKMPTYMDGTQAKFQKHLQQLVKYPPAAQNANIEGKVFLQFVVDKNGNIIQEKILKSPHPSLSEAVLTALQKTDKWQPGEQWGKKVEVSFTVPVFFKLNQ